MELVPAVDIRGGKCVRLRQGERLQEIIYAEDPVLMAQRWEDMGAKLLHIVDLDGAWAGKPQNFSVIQRIISAVNIPLQVGGGIRDSLAIKRYLDIGIEKIILGSSILKNPSFIEESCEKYPNKILLGIDTKEDYVAYDGWERVSERRAIDVALQYQELSLRAFIFTDIYQDGMLKGPNIKAIAEFAQKVNKPILAAGGIKNLAALFLFNGIPHFIQGICGKTHMTPFARVSRPVTNVVWGLANFFIGEAIMRLSKTGPWEPAQVGAFWLGAIVISIFLAIFWGNPEAKLPWHKD